MTSHERALVSTIIPVYNRAILLAEAVQSVLDQDYRPVEVIIVDDGSTDATASCVDDLARAHGEIRVRHLPNGGPGVAREAGRLLARGEFIQYLDSDDVLLPAKFSTQVQLLRSRADCGVAYGYTRYRHADGTTESQPWKGSGRYVETMFPSFLESRWWDTPNPLYRRLVCDAAGPWTDLRLEEDWEYDCRIASLGTRLAFTPTFVCEVRDHEGERLCRGQTLDPSRLSQRARSHQMILDHALAAGIDAECAEMQKFARQLFLLARQCGAAGLAPESKELFEAARQASGAKRASGIDFRLYSAAAALLGWPLAGRLACATDLLRK